MVHFTVVPVHSQYAVSNCSNFLEIGLFKLLSSELRNLSLYSDLPALFFKIRLLHTFSHSDKPVSIEKENIGMA